MGLLPVIHTGHHFFLVSLQLKDDKVASENLFYTSLVLTNTTNGSWHIYMCKYVFKIQFLTALKNASGTRLVYVMINWHYINPPLGGSKYPKSYECIRSPNE